MPSLGQESTARTPRHPATAKNPHGAAPRAPHPPTGLSWPQEQGSTHGPEPTAQQRGTCRQRRLFCDQSRQRWYSS